MNFILSRALRQFVSTFKEWNYFIGGLAWGVVLALPVGFLLGVAVTVVAFALA